MPWGGVSGSFADPDGHAWEVAWNPAFPIEPAFWIQVTPPAVPLGQPTSRRVPSAIATWPSLVNVWAGTR